MSGGSKFDVHLGKATRTRLVSQIVANAGGKIKYSDLKKQLKLRGYPHLHERLEAMGFWVDDDGNVKSSSG